MKIKNTIQTLALTALLAAVSAAQAHAKIQTHQPGDAKMSCKQLETEINAMNDIIEGANAKGTTADATNAAVGVGQFAATHLLGSAGGLFGIGASSAVGAGAGIASKNAKEEAQQAQMRYTALMGIHTGKGCAAATTEPAAGNTTAPVIKEEAPAAAPVKKQSSSYGND